MYLRGRIDRIDVHEVTHQRVLFDYKTGETARKPEAVHRHRKSEWIDLQLPLYRHLVKGFGIDDHLQLGYIMLPKVLGEVSASLAAWSPAELSQADDVAAHIVRQVRAERFWPPASLSNAFDEYAVLCQVKDISHPNTSDPAYGE